MGLLSEQGLIGSTPNTPGLKSEHYTPLKLTSKKYPNLGRAKPVEVDTLFHTIEQIATLESTLHFILESVKSKSTDVSFFCREYWGSSASMAQLSLDEIAWDDAQRGPVRRACVLESLSLAVLSHLSSGTMQDVSVAVRLKLRKLVYHAHANCLVFLDLVRQRWLAEKKNRPPGVEKMKGHCPYNLDFTVFTEADRYCTLRDGEHMAALNKNSEAIISILQILCQQTSSAENVSNVLSVVGDTLQGDVPLENLQVCAVRPKLLQILSFQPLRNIGRCDTGGSWPSKDPFERSGSDRFATDCTPVLFEPHPPIIANLDAGAFLPKQPGSSQMFTLVLDLDETLVHSAKGDTNSFRMRPGLAQFLRTMFDFGYELVTFTTATQEYADAIIDKIDPHRYIHHRLYRQHAVPWGPICIKDLSRLGRDLNRTLLIDNIADNFMLQPQNGITIKDWFEDPKDQALYDLVPLLEELISMRMCVADILKKYEAQIPMWAGFGGMQNSMRQNSMGNRSGYQSANQAGFGEIQQGVRSAQPMSQPVVEPCQQAARSPSAPTYMPMVMQVQPFQPMMFVNMGTSVAHAPALAPAQAMVIAQEPASRGPATQEVPQHNTPEVPRGSSIGIDEKPRRGIKNQKIIKNRANTMD